MPPARLRAAIAATDVLGNSVDGASGSTTLDDLPAITSNGGGAAAFISVAENTTAVTTVTATDPDVGDTQTYSDRRRARRRPVHDQRPNRRALLHRKPRISKSPPTRTPITTTRSSCVVTDSHGGADEQTITVSLTNVAGVSPPASNLAVINGTNEEDVLRGSHVANTLNGLGGNDTLNSGRGSDILNGGAGNDTFNGEAGRDTMRGGAGNDTYFVDNPNDVVDENVAGSGGIDGVQSSVAFNLSCNSTHALGIIENLTLTGNGNINATGNDADNNLTGNGGANVLDGGIGSDTMAGGARSRSTYVVDSAGDTVIEGSSGGTDLIRTTLAAYTLGANVENLAFTGTGNFQGTGNDLTNTITGGAGDDTLDGGIGTDRLIGTRRKRHLFC